MSIALLHAYRTANRGDGWLVELSRMAIREATGLEPDVYALDPAGMGPTARAVVPPPLRLRAAVSAASTFHPALSPLGRRAVALPDPADLQAAIGIGGGYLRSLDPTHEAIFRAHHLPQLELVAAMGPRGGYLPVSVGPFRAGLGRRVRTTLGRCGFVAVRDDRSARYLAGWAEPQRLPDLAAARLGIDRPRPRHDLDRDVVGVVLRSLPRSDVGIRTAVELEHRGMKARFGIQASQGRTNDDRRFYASHGLAERAEPADALLSTGPAPAVILAGRLHAALEAIAAGIPTIHLGYERKSAGAFADLGLTPWLVDAWTTGPEVVADLALALAEDPQPYWDGLDGRLDTLASAWHDVVERVAGLCRVP